ncbi:hybrid sensor histidine kinase/response regulator [Candidatus Synechococcus calcipolaris G9]|uniref:histidine kinase n=1 Tax=Candidatus Synechococcus calcipolaris G9 TaxID=1497997 RepID=A0ABT6EVJ2_9SYNE|nr:hybrid sensor histidine kinase/response regulator [Candidatus Synechococcus calcipolaris]MDG2989817.1 hybrid sensor histidine kinase/response regulator [Candidatus Synechococcus calcipolaris G9]
MPLNAADFDAITKEARSCFLNEDAPEYVLMLDEAIQRLQSNRDQRFSVHEYQDLMRAAHSLKGGAGIAQLNELQQVAHRLEDLLEALKDGQVGDVLAAHDLIALGVENIHGLINAAHLNQPAGHRQQREHLLTQLDHFLANLAPAAITPSGGDGGGVTLSPLVQTALQTDLEDCLKRVETVAKSNPEAIESTLRSLVQEAKLLGQALKVSWLVELSDQIVPLIEQMPGVELAPAVVAEFREARDHYLKQALASVETKAAQSPTAPEIAPSPTIADTSQTTPEQPAFHLRIPVTKLDRMGNTVSELLIGQERLNLYQSQFQRVSKELKLRIDQFRPIREQIQTIYDRLAIPLSQMPLGRSQGNGRVVNTLGVEAPETKGQGEDFDALQFDRYTDLHTTLQDFQEILARIQETGSDIDLLNRDLQDALDESRQHLNNLRGDLTGSRLVPFRGLAEKFIPALQTLSQRHHKPTDVVIQGSQTLVDQVVLEQLKAPLTHLVRNAFDHGIESPEVRQKTGKPAIATITLSASVSGNQVLISIQDDGGGINLEKVTQKALKVGLCTAESIPLLTQEQILEFLFMPGFSTAKEVSDLSGRGVGLDVVRLQVERLRGTVRIQTQLGQGTTFTLALPLTLSILPLILCQVANLTLAIPDLSVLEVIQLSEYTDVQQPGQTIEWKSQSIPLKALHEFLPYQRPLGQIQQPPSIGIVVDVNGRPCALSVNTLLAERELVLKPFDTTVNVPAYLMGCTVLGTGEVVPVLSPPNFESLLSSYQPPPKAQTVEAAVSDQTTVMIVDDSIAVRRLLERILSQVGYRVLQGRDGKEALEVLKTQGSTVALVITDVEMPRMDGYTLVKEIRSNPRLRHLPIAMLTSRGGDRHRQKAQQLGVDAYFSKPFQPVEMINQVSELVSKKGTVRG